MERVRSPLVSIPPLAGFGFSRHEGLPIRCLIWEESAKGKLPRPLCRYFGGQGAQNRVRNDTYAQMDAAKPSLLLQAGHWLTRWQPWMGRVVTRPKSHTAHQMGPP